MSMLANVTSQTKTAHQNLVDSIECGNLKPITELSCLRVYENLPADQCKKMSQAIVSGLLKKEGLAVQDVSDPLDLNTSLSQTQQFTGEEFHEAIHLALDCYRKGAECFTEDERRSMKIDLEKIVLKIRYPELTGDPRDLDFVEAGDRAVGKLIQELGDPLTAESFSD